MTAPQQKRADELQRLDADGTYVLPNACDAGTRC
jgi:hypothetical protein